MQAVTNGKHCRGSLDDPLSVADPEVYGLIKAEKSRQRKGLEMIASENFTSLAVLDCLASCLHNKYSEGMPNARYYGGNEVIDEIELLAQKRSLDTFGLSASNWGVNVQPYSGSPANFAVYTALAGPHGRIMGLDLPDGGHLTHGFFTPKRKVSATSMFFESMPYKVNPSTGLIDYDELEKTSKLFRPKIIIAGVSCYTRSLDYARFRKIADDCGAYLMADMAHVAGLVAAGLAPSPFDHCHIVTSTVHKTLRGPRAGIIFFRKGLECTLADGKEVLYDFEEKINNAVFPGLQGGPHNMAIAAIAVAMKHAKTEEFKDYQKNVLSNARALAKELQGLGYKIVTGGTDNHIVLVDLSPMKLSGPKGERILEIVGISTNKNTVPGDKSALNPSGIRFGLPPLTTRGVLEKDIPVVVGFIHEALQIGLEAQKLSGPKLADWNKALETDVSLLEKVAGVKARVEAFATQFALPGREDI